MSPDSGETHLSKIRLSLSFYMKNDFVFIWKRTSPVRSDPTVHGWDLGEVG